MPADQRPFRIVTAFLLTMMLGFWLLHAFHVLQKDDADLTDTPPAQSEILSLQG